MAIPTSLRDSLRPVTVVVGHYGTGKTNFSVNLAIDLASEGKDVTLVDLDVVNPYFRASEQRKVLEDNGVKLIAPVFAEAGTSLDVPSLSGRIMPAIQDAREDSYVIIDAGGDDVGATALGRFSRFVKEKDFAILYVANKFRNLVQDPTDAVEILQEIETACHLSVSAVVSNAHLKDETTIETVEEGLDYAEAVAQLAKLPLVAVCLPRHLTELLNDGRRYGINIYVRTIWE